MRNRSRARKPRTVQDARVMEERALEARAVTKLKILLDIANSLSVIANATASLASVSCLLA